MLVEECESIECVGADGSTNVDGTTEQASGISSLPSGSMGTRFDGKRTNDGARWTHGTSWILR